MRFLVIRSGSGWGGILGKYIIDTDESLFIDIDTHNKMTDDNCCCIPIELLQDLVTISNDICDKKLSIDFECIGFEPVLRKPISEFDKHSIKRIDLGKSDISNLEDRLSSAKINISHNTIFDIQVDDVYALIHGKLVHLVSTSYPLIWIEDEKLRNTVIEITGVYEMYTAFLT